MNKIACAIMVSLSGICLLKGETVPQKTEWKGGRLIYDGVIIKNQFNLPQKGIKYHDEDRLSYDVMDTTIEMSTTPFQKSSMRQGMVLQGNQPYCC